MHWYGDDIVRLLTHMPEALADLLHHEDIELVEKGIEAVKPYEVAPKHSLILPGTTGEKQGDIPDISLEKTIDPQVMRSTQNVGLLLHDYLHTLPGYEIHGPEGERLLKHWEELLLQQPTRLAAGQLAHWHSPRAKAFWQERLKHGNAEKHLEALAKEWEKSSGAELASHPLSEGESKGKQWQDLIIRQRLYHHTLDRTGYHGRSTRI